MPAEKPLLLVDVDGVISLFGFDASRPPAGRYQLVDGILHLLSASAGEHLRALAAQFELAWCTGWEEKANDYLPLALELGQPLPWLCFDGAPPCPGAHWKLAAIDAFAGPDRPLAWIDDAHDDACRTWATARPAATLLVATEPADGLTGAHVQLLLGWAQRLARVRPAR
ncbi:MAG: hypothetical protein JOZ64_15940 [Solirubrobacterales bacterium]|nr:hypothetical protein [Solirubrobacterales bacterium]